MVAGGFSNSKLPTVYHHLCGLCLARKRALASGFHLMAQLLIEPLASSLWKKLFETPVLVQKKSKNHRKQWVTFQKKGYPRVSLQKRYIFFAFFSWMEANTKLHKVRVMNASCSPSACSCSPVKHKKLRLFCRLTQLLRSNLCLWALFPILQKNFFSSRWEKWGKNDDNDACFADSWNVVIHFFHK